jgi:hypothetical protein
VEDGEFCRMRSAMTTRLASASHDSAMVAVVVTPSERVVAGGGFLNVYERLDDLDPGGCEPGQTMANRGTSVVAAPGDDDAPWSVVAMAATTSSIWIGRRDDGLLRVPIDFVLAEARYFRDDDRDIFGSATLPLPLVVDLAAAPGERVWAVVTDEDGLAGGLVRLDEAGPDLWVDASVVGGVPAAVDISRGSNQVWVVTETSVATFTDPS